MATNFNAVTVVGNVTRDPELRFISSGQAVASFTVAVNRSWKNRQNDEWQEQTSFIDVKCWAQMAENVAESLTKGTRVVVTGRMDQETWKTEAGDNRSKIVIVAEEVGPTLRFATASVTKTERREPDGSGGGGYAGGESRPSSDQPSGGSGGGSGSSGGGGGGYDPDEEPF
jgi:single-strand DNA-binding protein